MDMKLSELRVQLKKERVLRTELQVKYEATKKSAHIDDHKSERPLAKTTVEGSFSGLSANSRKKHWAKLKRAASDYGLTRKASAGTLS